MYETVDGPAHRWAYLRAAAPRDPSCGVPGRTAILGLAALLTLAGLTWGHAQLASPPPAAEAPR